LVLLHSSSSSIRCPYTTLFRSQLQEKQKLRYMYGLNERQFRNLFDKAGKLKGVHGENFMILLESRLDNLVYRLGYQDVIRVKSRSEEHTTELQSRFDLVCRLLL